jgi:hypothetical protein
MDLKKNAPKGEFLAYINKEEAAMLKKAGGSGKLVNGIPSFRPQDWGQEEKAKTARAAGKKTAASNPYAGAGQGSKSNPTVKDDGRGYTTETQDYNTYKATGGKNPLGLDIARIERDGPTLTPKEILKAQNQNLFYDNKPKYSKYIPKYIQAAANFNRKPNRKYFYEKYLKNNAGNLSYTDLEKAYETYMDNRMAGYTDAMGNTHPDYRLEGNRYVKNDRGANQPIDFNFQDQFNDPNEDGDGEEDNGDDSNSVDYTQDVIYENYGTPGYRTTRAAEGGIMGTRARRAMGGIMNRIDQRQGFFLGGIGRAIGKIGKAAGKVLSSDIGKAAIAGAAFYYGGGGASMFKSGGLKGMAGNFFSKSNPLLFNKAKELSLAKLAGVSTVLPFLAGEAKPNETSFSDRGAKMKDSKGNDAVGTDIRAEISEAYESGDPERIAAIEKYYSFLPPTAEYMPYTEYGDSGYRTTVATGGRIGRAEGGLMDLGGMEKDYRAEGGFVPIGEYEKKDDVPARLSVNEFVMTADAVRGAGQGDIDKGAEIMENMMKNLENGGTVSEESQGNKGAQQMFKTSERLGAII